MIIKMPMNFRPRPVNNFFFFSDRREVTINSSDVIVNEELRNDDLDAIEPSPLDDEEILPLVTDDSNLTKTNFN